MLDPAPAAPLLTLVPGVPPELETIVDKALAVAPGARYATARALADDLARFLAGQLVASHHYSGGERARRFVRRNAAAVVVGGLAAAALVAVATTAYLRVTSERDRADAERDEAVAAKADAEARRTEASDRADQLALGEARALAATNPTAAVARAKPLAAKWWREARAIGAAARAAGVAYGFPASPHTVALDVWAAHAVALGDDSTCACTTSPGARRATSARSRAPRRCGSSTPSASRSRRAGASRCSTSRPARAA